MTAEERQMQRADRFAAAWWASDLERQQAAARVAQAAAERADQYAAECARWLALQSVPAAYAEQGGAIGLDLGTENSHGAAVLGRHRPDGRLEIVADRIFDERTIAGARAAFEALRAQQAPPPPPVSSQPPIGAPGAAQAAPGASREGAKGAYARDTGDPGAVAGYRPPWAQPLGAGERRR